MFSVLPFAKAVGSVFLFLFFGCLAVLIGCPIVDKAKLIRVATPVDKYFVFVAIICTLYIICASCIVERVLVPVVLEVIDAHFPQAVSKSTTLRLPVLSNKLNWGHKVVGHWSYCSLLHIVFQRSVDLKAQNFTTVSFVRKEVHDVKLVRVIQIIRTFFSSICRILVDTSKGHFLIFVVETLSERMSEFVNTVVGKLRNKYFVTSILSLIPL